jgi:methylamine dehydrogenase accessory protein MauD
VWQKERKTIPLFWIIVIIALWAIVLFVMALQLLVLRALGELGQKGIVHSADSQPASSGGLNIGERVPLFEAVDFNGDTIRLEDFQEQRLILGFISPGCRACAEAIRALNAIQQDEPDLSILIVGSSDRSLNQIYAAEHASQIPILTPTTNVERLYRVPGVPFIFVLDDARTIRTKGFVNYREDISQMLTTALSPVSSSITA